MKKFIVEYRENENKRPLVELKDFIFIGQYEAESAQEAALQAAGATGRENIAFRVTEVLENGEKATGVHLIDFI